MNQFIRIPIQIINSGIIEFMEKQHFRVYACLDSHKNRQWQSFPSLATIKHEIKMCTRVIQAAIKDLAEWGLIKKAYIKREKGRGYRIIYTIIKEPSIKIPHKRIKEKIFNSAKRKRDLKGKFTEQKQPPQRTVLNRSKQPLTVAIIQPKKSKQPLTVAVTSKPLTVADPKSLRVATIQSSLTSINQYKKNHPQNNSSKEKKPKSKPLSEGIKTKPRKPKLDTSEKGFQKQREDLIAKIRAKAKEIRP